jgi:autotransporter translocation and assembly factor TamB
MKRLGTIYWRRGIAALSVVIAILFGGIYITLATETGTRWAFAQLEMYIPIHIKVVHGNLINGLAIEVVEYQNQDISINAKNSVINLDLWLLLFNQQLKISELSSDSIEITTKTSESSSNNTLLVLPSLPFTIELKRLNLDNIKINDFDPMSVLAERITFAQQSLSWQSLVYAFQDISLQSNGDWQSGSIRQSLNTRIEWQRDAINGSLDLQGPLNQLNLKHDFYLTDVHVFSTGSIAINALNDINIELDNELDPLLIEGLNIEKANLKVNTNLQDVDFSLTAQLNQPQTGAIKLTSEGSGPITHGFKIISQIDILSGHITALSDVSLHPELIVKNTFEGTSLHFAELSFWPLDAQLTANIKGQLNVQIRNNVQWSLPELSLEGTLAENPLILELAAKNDTEIIEITKLNAYHINDKLAARAILNKKYLTGSGVLKVADWQHYLRNLKGDSEVEFQIATDLNHWQESNHITLLANSEKLSIGTFDLGGITLNLQNEGHLFEASFASEFLQQGKLAMQNLNQQISGNISQDKVTIEGNANSQLIFQGKSIELPPIAVSAHWQAKGEKQAEIKLTSNDTNLELNSQITLARNHQLQGEITLLSPHLKWLQEFSPRIKDIDGYLEVNSLIAGRFESPSIETNLLLEVADLNIIDPNIALQQIKLNGALNALGEMTYQGTAKQQNKPINIDGRGWIFGDNSPRFNVHIDAEKLSANTPKIEVAVSPNIDIAYANQNIAIKGAITIPNADIEVSQLPNPSFNVSPDVIVVGRKSKSKETTLEHIIDLDVIINDNTLIKAAGLATKLKGKLHYKSQTNRADHIQGKLFMVDGRLNSSGQDLFIKKGELIFTGSPDNPSLDIIAMRKITSPEIEVGLHITGTLKDMKTEITSSPLIDSSKALSYLAFGKDITQDTETSDSNAQLMSAAMSLGIGQSSQLIQNLRRSTGLDELAAITNDSGSASLIAGKQLSSKLFARYRYDIAEALGILMLRYTINQQWSIEAESGNNTSVDVLYRLND